MSYDFLMLKTSVPIDSQHDLSEDIVLVQAPEKVMAELSRLLPGLSWGKCFGGFFWEALTEDEEGQYELHVPLEPSQSWSIRTSHRRGRRDLVARICKSLGVVAFDGQAMLLIDERGERPA